MDKVRIEWEYVPPYEYSDGDVDPGYWQARVNGEVLFNHSDRGEFFARYSAIVVEKQDASSANTCASKEG